ncbi:hypothetical protein TUM20984_31640 [Mycobacterium antarcticum]|nr:hypothetical protein TUM20984_31640 [Mycolicibacterium sp. TUM20984]
MTTFHRPAAKTIARTAALAAAAGCTALALASPASAQKSDTHLAVDCPQPFSQSCDKKSRAISFPTDGRLFVSFTADPNPPACAPGRARIFVDGREWGSNIVQPGQNDGGYFIETTPGRHTVQVQMDGVLGGCNTGSMSGWSGNLRVETDADAADGAG